jgi:hypothetical protein
LDGAKAQPEADIVDTLAEGFGCTGPTWGRALHRNASGRAISSQQGGPAAEQMWVAAHDEIHVEVGKQVKLQSDILAAPPAPCVSPYLMESHIDHLGRADMCPCSLLDVPINKGAVRTGKLVRVQGQRGRGKEYGGVRCRPQCSIRKATTVCY